MGKDEREKRSRQGRTREALGQLRREYEEIPVPPQARERVLAGMAAGKEANRAGEPAGRSRRRLMRCLRGSGMAAAAAVMLVAGLANFSPTVASAMENIPVIGAIARVVTIRTYEDRNGGFEADIEVPQVEGEDGQAGEVAANKSIEEYAKELIAQYESDLKASNGEGNYSLSSTYQVVTDTPRYLAIRIDTTQVMASGAESVKIFMIDKQSGQTVSLAGFFAGQPGMLEKISANIKQQMKAQMEADDSVTYFLDSDTPEWDFKGLTGEESYYFNGRGELVVAFDEYEVAPGYMGAVEFTIPASVTGQLNLG